MKPEIYSKVQLVSGEIGYVVDVYKDGEAFEIELPHFDLRTIKPEDIAKVFD